jgi:hypothetical protein
MMTWHMTGMRLLLCACVTIMMLGRSANAGWAQTDTVTVDISPQALDRALTLFADQMNLQVLYASDLVRGLTTQGVTGVVTPQDALVQLLDGTGLAYTFVDGRTIALHKTMPTPSSAESGGPSTPMAESKPKKVTLPEVVVKDVREREDSREDRDVAQLKEIAGTVNVVTREEIQLARPKNAS